jgi:hypothetical protein
MSELELKQRTRIKFLVKLGKSGSEDLYDVTDSSLISIRFQSGLFRFYSTDGISGRYCMSTQIFPNFFALVLMHLILVVTFLAQISTSFSILVPRKRMLYHNVYCSCF